MGTEITLRLAGEKQFKMYDTSKYIGKCIDPGRLLHNNFNNIWNFILL